MENDLSGLKEFIEKFTKLNTDDWQIIQDAFEPRLVKKNEIILQVGEICRYFYFFESGLIRFFTIKDGNDITKTFTIPPYCFTAKTSFRYQKASQEGIQALEKTTLWQTSYNQVNKLAELKSWNTFIHKLVNEVQEFTDDFMMEIRTETAELRYRKLMEKYPVIINKIPLKHLSTFLGIAPQSLSRIRKKLHENRKS